MNASDPNPIYTHMQSAVDIVQDSPHPSNKIAATIAGEDFAISKTNHWPQPIADAIGTKTKIGNSSGTIHAETACIFAANAAGFATKNASIFITDPPCPNCMKNMAEAGIDKLYIDHKGFDKDWASRRGNDFETMSMRIAAKAGLDVFAIYRKEQRIEMISEHPPGYQPIHENLASINPLTHTVSSRRKPGSDNSTDQDSGFRRNDTIWEDLINNTMTQMKNEAFALALGTNQNNQTVSITTTRHPTIGYSHEDVEGQNGKYSFILEPLNRLITIAAREGLKLDPDHIFSSRCPTSRELVNFIGAGFSTLHIADSKTARDDFGPLALDQLQKAKVLNIQHKA